MSATFTGNVTTIAKSFPGESILNCVLHHKYMIETPKLMLVHTVHCEVACYCNYMWLSLSSYHCYHWDLSQEKLWKLKAVQFQSCCAQWHVVLRLLLLCFTKYSVFNGVQWTFITNTILANINRSTKNLRYSQFQPGNCSWVQVAH